MKDEKPIKYYKIIIKQHRCKSQVYKQAEWEEEALM